MAMLLKHQIHNNVCPICGGELLNTREQVFDYGRQEKLHGYPRPVSVKYYAPITECDSCKARYVHKESGIELLV